MEWSAGDIRNLGPLSQLSAISSRHKIMMKDINELEARQQILLHKQNLIGRVTNKRVEDYRITIRGVNFRWQRGIKIGENRRIKCSGCLFLPHKSTFYTLPRSPQNLVMCMALYVSKVCRILEFHCRHASLSES